MKRRHFLKQAIFTSAAVLGAPAIGANASLMSLSLAVVLVAPWQPSICGFTARAALT